MIDLGKLAAQGRAFSASRAWEPAELDALLTLERDRSCARDIAANYIRNGILTLESFDAAVKAGFVPLTTEDAVAKAEALLKQNKFATKETGAESVVETPVEAKAESVVETPVKGVSKSGKKK